MDSTTPIAAPEATAPVATPEVVAPRTFKVTVNGAERDVDEAELLRGYQKVSAADEKFEQANEQYKIAEEVMRLFRTNPKEAFAKLGVDAKTFAESVIQEHMEELQLTPEQKELRDAKRRLEEYQSREAKEKADREAMEQEAFQSQFTQQVQHDIISTMDSAGLPKNAHTIGRFAYWMDVALSQRGDYVPAKEVAAIVRNEYEEDIKAMLGSLPEDQLLNFLGDDISKKALKASAAKYKPQPAPTVQPVRRESKTQERPLTALEKRAARRAKLY